MGRAAGLGFILDPLSNLVELLFDLVGDDWLLDWHPGGPRLKLLTPDGLLGEMTREADTLGVPTLLELEAQRQAGRSGLAEFRRRYAAVAGCEPTEDPAFSAVLGPHADVVNRLLTKLRSMQESDWDLAEEHLRNLQANQTALEAVLPQYNAALRVAITCARVSAAAAVREALRQAIPEERGPRWEFTLAWLPLALVADSSALSAALAAPLRGAARTLESGA